MKDYLLSESETCNNIFVDRFLLTSSRAFKRSIFSNQEINDKVKHFVEALPLPRFQWLVEISTVDKYLDNRSLGFIIIDAMGAPRHLDSVIAIIWRSGIRVNKGQGIFSFVTTLREDSFPLYVENLKLYKNER